MLRTLRTHVPTYATDTKTMLSIHCPVKDTPWVPWDPISGFPTAGFSCLREGQPQAKTPTQWQAQGQPPGSMSTNTTANISSSLVIFTTYSPIIHSAIVFDFMQFLDKNSFVK